MLPRWEYQPPQPAVVSVIFLHGIGADGHDLAPLARELVSADGPPTRFVMPHAPVREVGIFGGMPARAWFDVMDTTWPRTPDIINMADLASMTEAVRELIRREEREMGIPAHRVVLAGFSQGGAVALHAGVTYPDRLGGILALSTYLPTADVLEADRKAGSRGPVAPVFMAHGTVDPMVPIASGRMAREALLRWGYPVEWREYPMEHAISGPEISDIRAWLTAISLIDDQEVAKGAAR